MWIVFSFCAVGDQLVQKYCFQWDLWSLYNEIKSEIVKDASLKPTHMM